MQNLKVIARGVRAVERLKDATPDGGDSLPMAT